MSGVNYKVKDIEGKKSKSVHINSMKRFVETAECVNAVTILADDDSEFIYNIVLLSGDVQGSCDERLWEFLNEFSEMLDISIVYNK